MQESIQLLPLNQQSQDESVYVSQNNLNQQSQDDESTSEKSIYVSQNNQ
jgi:hypothetical protein